MFITENSSKYFNEIYFIWNFLDLFNRCRLKSLIENYNKGLKNYIENLDKSKIIKLDAEYCPTCGQELPKEEPKKSIPYKFSDSKVIDYNRFTEYYELIYYMYAYKSINVWSKGRTSNNEFQIKFKEKNTIIWTTEYPYVNLKDIPYQYKLHTAIMLSFINRLIKAHKTNQTLANIYIEDMFSEPKLVYYYDRCVRNEKLKRYYNPVEKELMQTIEKVNNIIKNKEKLPQELENILLCDNFLELVYNNEFDGVDLMNSHTENKKARLYYE